MPKDDALKSGKVTKKKYQKAVAKVLQLTEALQRPGHSVFETAKLQAKLDAKLANVAKHQAFSDKTPEPCAAVKNPYLGAPKATAPTLKTVPLTAEERQRRQERQQRFLSAAVPKADAEKLAELRAKRGVTVFGTSTSLEKEYLRLTSLPLVDSVRPPAVLHQALELVKSRWLQEPDYGHACEQLKAIRQDLTVQHESSTLAVDAYQTHARIALEAGDVAEFNQCQTALCRLFREERVPGEEAEFAAYGLLYAAVQRTSLLEAIAGMPPAIRRHPFVDHALQVTSAVAAGNYHAFFALFGTAPRVSAYLMDHFVPRVRTAAVATMLSSYGASLPLDFAAAELGFDREHEAVEFLAQMGVVTEAERNVVYSKASCQSAAVC